MKLTKKLVGLSTAFIIGAISLVACGEAADKAPDYSSYRDTNIMGISAWVAPPPGNWNNKGYPNQITDEGYKKVAECGLNSIYALYEFLSSTYTAEAARLAGKYGIKYYARDTGNITGDPIEDELEPGDIRDRAYVQEYCNEPGFAGHLATDEPGASKFTQLGHLKEFYEEEFPGKEFYVNLFPCYASLSQIETDSYEDYIDQYISKVNPSFLSYDHYALEEDAYGHVKYSGSVLYNHYVVAKKASAAGIPYGNFTQTLKFSGSSRTITKEEELRWQIMVDLAYGCSRVQYFTYYTPIEWSLPMQEGLIDAYGECQPTYYFAQKINSDIAFMDEAYLNYEWVDTLLVDGEDSFGNGAFDMIRDDAPTSISGLDSITANLDTIVGQFNSKVDDYKAYMITNFSEPSNGENIDAIQATFGKKKHAMIYDKGEVKTVDLDKGVLNYDITPGNGIFVIPF